MSAPLAAVTSTGGVGRSRSGKALGTPEGGHVGGDLEPSRLDCLAGGVEEEPGRNRDAVVVQQLAERCVPSGLDLAVEVDERDEPAVGCLCTSVAATAEADVLLEAQRPRASPVLFDALPASVRRCRVDDDALRVFGHCGRRERAQGPGQALRPIVVDEDDRKVRHSARRTSRQ